MPVIHRHMKTKRRLTIAGIVVGSLLTLSPVFGFLNTVFGMMRAFHTLAGSGFAEPKALAERINVTLLSTATGLFLLPFGIVILAISLIFYFQLRASTPPPLPTKSGQETGNA